MNGVAPQRTNPPAKTPRARRGGVAGAGSRRLAGSADSKKVLVSGRIERVLFQGRDGFCVLSVRDVGIVVGNLLDARSGADVEGEGERHHHPKFGEQIKAHWLAERVPEEAADLLAFLSRGALPGIGSKLAKVLVDRFGAQLPHVFENQPRRLLEINGIGEKKLTRIRAAWDRLRGVRRVAGFLSRLGLGPQMAWRVWSEFGANAIALLKADPYRLTRVAGIGFERADEAAKRLGLAPDAPQRLAAAIDFAADTQSRAGHTVTSADALVRAAAQLCGQPQPVIRAHLAALLSDPDGRLVESPYGISLRGLYWAEHRIAEEIRLRLQIPGVYQKLHPRPYFTRMGLMPDDLQMQALVTCLTHGVAILTGGPGTGKTTILRALVDAAQESVNVRLCAPTGRAARRLAEATGVRAETIHRLLGARGPGQFEHGPESPIDCELLIVDESSMLDAPLLRRMLDALTPGCRIVFVGDSDQLPSVGPGACLSDLLAAGVPAVRLSRVYRQDEGSGIALGAQSIRTGALPERFAAGLWMVEDDAPDTAAGRVVDLACRAVKKYGPDGVQVLSPMRRGALGTTSLNAMLKMALNPHAASASAQSVAGFHLGDRVVQVRNDYELGVMNGEIGRIVECRPSEKQLVVQFDEHVVEYDSLQANGLELAFAITIHKSQGGQYPCAIIPISMQHYVMLCRPLIYTAITRAERDAVLVGQTRALRLAVDRAGAGERRTLLRAFLDAA